MAGLAGQLLIANGNLFGPVFRQTVILMAEHNDDGALGFVLNRPTEMEVESATGLPDAAVPDRRVFGGGPVQPDAVALIAEFDDPVSAARPIFGAVGFASADQLGGTGVRRVRVFAGYSGWGPGQLEDEIAEGSWLLEAATVEHVFDLPPETMWREILRRKGEPYSLMATMPFDPTVN